MTNGPSQSMNLGGKPTPYGDSFVSLDLMKGADNWRYQGASGDILVPKAALDFDARGWLKHLPVVGGEEKTVWSNVFYTKAIPAGQYILEWKGEGSISVYQNYTVIGPNKILLNYEANYVGANGLPIDDGITVGLDSTDPNNTGNYIRDIKLYRAQDADLIDAGERFNPNWQNRIDDFRILRTHDWQNTNFPDTVNPSRNVFSADQALWGKDGRGMPYELIVDMANDTRSDLWINIPHTASDSYMRAVASYVKDHLDPDLKLQVEFSNEYWTTIFDQNPYFTAGGIARYGAQEEYATGQNYAVQAAHMADIFRAEFGQNSSQLKPVLTVDNVFFLTDEAEKILNAPAEVALGGTAPITHGFEVIATDGYLLWTADSEYYANLITDWMTDADGGFGRARDFLINQLNTELLPSWVAGRALADKYGLEFQVYEGGALLLNVSNEGVEGDPKFTDFAIRFTASAEMKEVYEAELAAWKTVGTGPFAWYDDVGRGGAYGDYGHWKGIDFLPQPRADALTDANENTAPWWTGDSRPASTFDNGKYLAGTMAADRMVGTALRDKFYGLAGADKIEGLAGHDKLWAGAGNDSIYGGLGNDEINGGAGADIVNGGAGRDIVDYRNSTAAISINLNSGVVSGGDAVGDILIAIESVRATNFADRLVGSNDSNLLLGRGGNDTLSGSGGNDLLNGGSGLDVLTGGTGNDRFVYYKPAEGGDRIADFSSKVTGNNDLFYLQGVGFGKHKAGALLAAEFQSSNAEIAANAKVRFFFDKDDHKLYYDADGNGSTAAVLIATLHSTAVVTVDDFLFF